MTDEPVIDVTEKVAYVRFERVTSPEQYGKRTASVSIPVVLTGEGEKDSAAIDFAADQARAVVLTAVGIPYSYVDGKLTEGDAPAAAVTRSNDSGSSSSSSSDHKYGDPDEVKPCPICEGPTYNNRRRKEQGKIKSNAPDFKCKNYNECDGVIWPPK